MQDIYTENILEKSKDKSFDLEYGSTNENQKYILENYIVGHGVNHSCGDIGDMYFLLEEKTNQIKIIKNIKLKKEGCAISQAGLVMLSEKLIGKNIMDVENLSPGDIYNMLGIQISPSRAGCALLCYNAFEDFLKKK